MLARAELITLEENVSHHVPPCSLSYSCVLLGPFSSEEKEGNVSAQK